MGVALWLSVKECPLKLGLPTIIGTNWNDYINSKIVDLRV
jgi:hypothetical protein